MAPAGGTAGGIAIDARPTVPQELLLVLCEPEGSVGCPRFGQLEPAACEQEARIGAGGKPVVRGRLDPPAGEQVIARFVDPALEAGPFGEDRLMGDLDRRCPGGGIAIERQ